jgi:hypothetical protein
MLDIIIVVTVACVNYALEEYDSGLFVYDTNGRFLFPIHVRLTAGVGRIKAAIKRELRAQP